MNLCKDCVSINLCGNPNVTGCISYTKQDEKFLPINCYVCNASGRIMGNGHRPSQICQRCNGTGTIDYHSLTNEDFLRMATRQQLAEFLAGVINTNPCGYLLFCNECGLNDRCCEDDYPSSKEAWGEWLKQPRHNE